MIREFYRARTILLTGVPGFYGQGLLAKILRDLTDVERIYVAIRTQTLRDGTVVSVQERLETLFASAAVFARFRSEAPEAFAKAQQKVIAISCDILKPGLGLAPEVRPRLEQELDLVISAAATVSFDDPLDHSLQLNTLGPQKMLDLVRSCKKETILVHVSTAYVNGRLPGTIPEEPLPVDRDIAQMMAGGQPAVPFDVEAEVADGQARCRELVQRATCSEQEGEFRREIIEQSRSRQLSESRLAKLMDGHRKRWLERELVEEGMSRAQRHGWNDVYTFTKGMGEQLLVKNRGDTPLVIVRPAVTESSLADPEPGWIHGLKVTDPLVVAYGRGLIPDFPARRDAPMDLVPIDIVVNAILVAGTQATRDEVRVFHAATSGENPLLNTEMFRYIKGYFEENPLLGKDGSRPKLVEWTFPSVEQFHRALRWRYLYPLEARRWLFDKLPGIASSKKKRRLAAIKTRFRRVMYFVDLFSPYTTLDCRFPMGNMLALYEKLSPEEQQLFNVDVRLIDWEQYYQHTHLPGLRRHVLKGEGLADPVFAEGAG